MASNSTPFYALSQWAGTDNFSRADFNSDNSKIDTALANLSYKQKAQPWEKIASVQPGVTVTSLSLPLEGVDISQYLQLVLFVDVQAGDYAESYHYLRLNGVSSNTYYKSGETEPVNYLMRVSLKEGYPKSRTVRFFPYEIGAFVCCGFESAYGADAGTNTVIATEVKWENLKSIDYVAASTDAPVNGNTTLYLYGIKKV